MGMIMHLIGLVIAYLVFKDSRSRGHAFVTSVLWAVGCVAMAVVIAPLYLIVGRNAGSRQRPRDPDIIDIEATVVEDTVNCSMCGNKVQEDLIVCPHCHHTLKPKCKSCGQELSREWKICPRCQTRADFK
jgi:hypothetical protein